MKRQKSKGFTLIELLVTILLLSIIGIISFISITTVIKKSKKNECLSFYDNIKSATNEYISDNRLKINDFKNELGISQDSNFIILTADKLIDNNYLKNNDSSKTDEYFESIIIRVTLDGSNNVSNIIMTSSDEDVFNTCEIDDMVDVNTITLSNKFYSANFYYQSNSTLGSTTTASTSASCQVSILTNTCDLPVPDAVKKSMGTYNNAYYGLTNNVGSMTRSITASAESVTLAGDTNYYAIYSTSVKIYHPTSIDSRAKATAYRNQWFSSNTTMSSTVLSKTRKGTSDNYTYTSGVSDYDLLGYATKHSTNTVDYVERANLRQSNVATVYVVLNKNTNSTIYYYNKSASTQASVTSNGTQYLRCTSSGAELISDSISIPTIVTDSKGPDNAAYQGISTNTNSTTITTNPTIENTQYYAVYNGQTTISFTTGEGSPQIGATSRKCQNYYLTNGSTYNGQGCNITLPSITSSYEVLGWFNGATLIGQPNEQITIHKSATYTATVLTARDLIYSVNGSTCTDVQCMINYLASIT